MNESFDAQDDATTALYRALVLWLLDVKLDDGWPESEEGDVTAALNMMITR